MPWRNDHLYGVETYDEMVARQREREDPYPGVSSLDEARADRHRNLEPAPGRLLRLVPSSRLSRADGPVPTPASPLGSIGSQAQGPHPELPPAA